MNNFSCAMKAPLCGIDWQTAWERYEATRSAPGDAAYWSGRARQYGLHSTSSYERDFIARAAVKPSETVLDFGCGTGLLAIPYARMGCKVIACDFAPAMLDVLRENAEAAGVGDRIETRLVAWDDDWAAAGLTPGCVDVALASRSIATPRLLDAVTKLDSVARRRVCISCAAGRSPRRDERAYEAVGRQRPQVSDHVFCINILFQHGIFPELSYITDWRRPAFVDHAEACAHLSEMMGSDLDASETDALDAFIDAHYAYDPCAPVGRTYVSDEKREIRWAFIAW